MHSCRQGATLGGEGQLKQHCNYDYVGAINYDYVGTINYHHDDSHDYDHESSDYNHHRRRRCREAWSATFDR